MCFKYFRGSERAPQTQRSAHMKTSYVCHTLHRGVCMRARQRRRIMYPYTSYKKQLRGGRAFGAQRGGKKQQHMKAPLATPSKPTEINHIKTYYYFIKAHIHP